MRKGFRRWILGITHPFGHLFDRHQIVFGVKVVEHLITLLQLDRLFMRYLSDRLMQFVSSFLLNIHAMNTFVNCAHNQLLCC